MTSVTRRLEDFFFAPASECWLRLLRIGSALQVICYCLTSWLDWRHLFADDESGLAGRGVSELFLSGRTALTPRLGWMIDLAVFLHLRETFVLPFLGIVLFVAGLSLLAGLFCRESALVAWFIHLGSVKSAGLTSYGMDNLTTIALFYLAIAPLPDGWSLDATFRKIPLRDPARHGFHRRLLQLHLCLIYFFSGITKALGPAWWNGESVWRALIRPPFNLISPQLLSSYSAILPIAGIAVVILEMGYPVCIWPKHTRHIWLGAIIAMHVGIAATMGLYLFGLIMVTLNISAFGPELRRASRKQLPAADGCDSARRSTAISPI